MFPVVSRLCLVILHPFSVFFHHFWGISWIFVVGLHLKLSLTVTEVMGEHAQCRDLEDLTCECGGQHSAAAHAARVISCVAACMQQLFLY